MGFVTYAQLTRTAEPLEIKNYVWSETRIKIVEAALAVLQMTPQLDSHERRTQEQNRTIQHLETLARNELEKPYLIDIDCCIYLSQHPDEKSPLVNFLRNWLANKRA